LDPIGAVMLVLMILGYAPIAWGKPVPINPAYLRGGRRGAALATAAGPASNLSLALAVALLWRLVHQLTGTQLAYGSGLYALLVALMGANVALAAFNLIPLPPLDGFGILEGVAPYSWLRVLEPLRRYGMWLLLVLVLGGGVLWSPLFRGLYRLVALVAGL
jgi:Zn-dependent protease